MRNGGFAMHGMGGQFALCLPDKSLTLITNAYDELNAHALCTVFDAFWEEIYPNLSPRRCPRSPRACAPDRAHEPAVHPHAAGQAAFRHRIPRGQRTHL